MILTLTFRIENFSLAEMFIFHINLYLNIYIKKS